jgi:hypothetical protein
MSGGAERRPCVDEQYRHQRKVPHFPEKNIVLIDHQQEEQALFLHAPSCWMPACPPVPCTKHASCMRSPQKKNHEEFYLQIRILSKIFKNYY